MTEDKAYYNYVKSLLLNGAIDDLDYVSKLNDDELDKLIKSWQEDADIIDMYSKHVDTENQSLDSDINYFAWVIAYEFKLKEIGEKYGISECDKLYDFCNYIATWYVKNSEEYKNLKYSSYEMFYKFVDNHKGLENLFKDYFNITYNKNLKSE